VTRSRAAALPILLALFNASACGGSGDPHAPAAGAATADASSDEPAPERIPKSKDPRGPIDPSKTGTIRGVVSFEGEAPARQPLAIGSTGGCPEHAAPPLSEIVLVENGRLANVFVWIRDGLDGWDLPPAKNEDRAIDQKGCLYTPHVVGVRTGDRVVVRNSDPTTHNVNIRSRSNDSRNLLQPPNGQPVEWAPTKKELGVPFECNLHPWMRAYVCVVDEPWFAVTKGDGAFALEGVPPGEYLLESWHEKYGKKTAKVRLDPGGSADASFAYKATEKPR